MKTFKSKVTQHRGNSRVWIEGKQLEQAGFPYHKEYFATYFGNGRIFIFLKTPDTYGHAIRKVSGRKRKDQARYLPIIDLCSKKVTETLGGAEYVEITLDKGRISIFPVRT